MFARGDNTAALIVAALIAWTLAPSATVHGTYCGQCELNARDRLAAHSTARPDPGDQAEVPPAQVNKYIAVYVAMQRNHSLTVEQAAARQGLTVSAFRDLENRIERNPALHDRVLQALRAAAKTKAQKAEPTPPPK